jgi:hypothetical protein
MSRLFKSDDEALRPPALEAFSLGTIARRLQHQAATRGQNREENVSPSKDTRQQSSAVSASTPHVNSVA